MAKSSSRRIFKAGKPRPQLHPGKPLTLDIERLSDEGRGIANRENKVVFVEGALPGESVLARITRQQKRFDEAVMTECLSPSEQRAQPFCPHYQHCGGCQLQHLKLDQQRQHKQARLQRAVQQTGNAIEMQPILAGNDQGYRHRARLSYQQGRLGFRARGSHDTVDIPLCPVLDPALNRTLKSIRPVLLNYLAKVGDSELELALGDAKDKPVSETWIGLNIRQSGPAIDETIAALEQALQGCCPALRLYRVAGNAGSVWQKEHAPLAYSLNNDKALHFIPGDFTQANCTLNRMMLTQVQYWLGDLSGQKAVDYFCGLGNFSRLLASLGAAVTAFDSGENMLARASQQAADEQLDIHYAQADLFDPEQLHLPAKVSLALLDPPRAGAKLLCELLASSKRLKTLVYVSCDPASLQRDLATLTQGGFRIDNARAVDMFPHSQHMESLVLLRR